MWAAQGRLHDVYSQEAGYGETDPIVYSRAEAVLERCLGRVESSGARQIEPQDVGSWRRFCAKLIAGSNARSLQPLAMILERAEDVTAFQRYLEKLPE
ncbi:hypothetical protein BGL_1c25780 [Burkholderia plantarii]|uniref:Uncharacterized protein n=1 Tax=Burkholderia plantarii TaxID=41899 RepID=A0A0B6RP07_BURPL|nr:hypothetical protein BGL_1c25780 [Burkholderia plantarii]